MKFARSVSSPFPSISLSRSDETLPESPPRNRKFPSQSQTLDFLAGQILPPPGKFSPPTHLPLRMEPEWGSPPIPRPPHLPFPHFSRDDSWGVRASICGTPCMGKVLDESSKASSSSPSPSSSTTSITDTINGSHHFRINGYSLWKGIGGGKFIASDTFTVGGYQWAIYFYPDGKRVEDNAAYVSLFIALASEGSDVRALFELTLLDQSGKERHKVHSHFGRTLESGPYTLKNRGSTWGYKRFFKRSLLETSDYLKDDTLSVHCIVGVVRSHTEGPKIFSIPVPPSSIGQDFGKLLDSEKGTDVSFEVDGEVFPAHKLVLAARSPVFRAQLYGPMKDLNTKHIRVEDMEPSVFKALLHFMYFDSLPDLQELTGLDSKWASTLMSRHIVAAADRYGLDRLRRLCEANLCHDVAINNQRLESKL